MYDFIDIERPKEAQKKSENAAGWVARNLGIEPDEQQARVLGTDCRRGILNCTRQWGKSTIAAAKAVYQAESEPGSLTVVVSPTARQSGELVKKAKQFARRMGTRVKGDSGIPHSMVFPNKSRIVGLPGTEATVRGFSAVSLLLVDEASRLGDDMYRAIRPMLAVSDGALWLMSTPYGKSGFFYEAWTNGPGEWERISVPATSCTRISERHLREEREALGERSFRQEYLCEFSDAESGVFDRDMVERAVSRECAPLVIR